MPQHVWFPLETWGLSLQFLFLSIPLKHIHSTYYAGVAQITALFYQKTYAMLFLKIKNKYIYILHFDRYPTGESCS